MSFEFDFDKIAEQITDAAVEHMYKALEEAKRELGPDGHGIEINKTSLRRIGDEIDLGSAKFPSEEIRDRFLVIVRRKMQ